MKDVLVDEGVESVWFYHLKEKGTFKAFCGRPLLGKDLPLTHWGIRSEHIGEKYCKKCEKIYHEKGGKLG